MNLYHLTLRRNTCSIRRTGLSGERASGKLKVVWLGTARYCRVIWDHQAIRHGVAACDLVAFEVQVPRAWRKRKWRGVWFSIVDLPPAAIGRRLNKGEVSRA